MPRPSRKELTAAPLRYFPHDSDALQDEKCQRLVYRYGPAGYGRFWMLCERLAAVDGHAIPYGDEDSNAILASWLLFDDVGECVEFIEFLLRATLCTKFAPENKNSPWLIRSNRMDKQAQKIGNLRAVAAKNRAKKGCNGGR